MSKKFVYVSCAHRNAFVTTKSTLFKKRGFVKLVMLYSNKESWRLSICASGQAAQGSVQCRS